MVLWTSSSDRGHDLPNYVNMYRAAPYNNELSTPKFQYSPHWETVLAHSVALGFHLALPLPCSSWFVSVRICVICQKSFYLTYGQYIVFKNPSNVSSKFPDRKK